MLIQEIQGMEDARGETSPPPNGRLTHQNSTTSSKGRHSQKSRGSARERRETFKWSGVKVSYDAESVKIENEATANGVPPGPPMKAIGKEVGHTQSIIFFITFTYSLFVPLYVCVHVYMYVLDMFLMVLNF